MLILEVIISVKIYITFALSIVYLYLYFQYHEKYMSKWALSWIFFSTRLVLDLARYNGYENFILISSNLLFSILSVYFLLLGIYEFTGNKLSKWWVISCVCAVSMSNIFYVLDYNKILITFPTALYFGIVNVWAGITLIRYWLIKGLGKYITSYAFILLGIVNGLYPFTSAVISKLTNYAFFIGSVFEIIILVGILLLYFQKVRTDLSISEERFRLLSENAVDIIYLYKFGVKAGFEYINPVVKNIIGYTAQDFYKDSNLLYSIVHEDDLHLLNNLKQKIESEIGPIIIRVYHKDGRLVWAEHHFTQVVDNAGDLIAIQGIIRDITERKLLEKEMARIDKFNVIGEMAAGISHEIRNPLTVVRGFLQLLEQKDDCQNYKDYYELMISELDRANSIITEYLSLAKNKIIDLKQRNLNVVIKSILPLIQADSIVSEIIIETELMEIPECIIDENEIKQLILNMVRNGMEAMSTGGILKIKTLFDGNEIVLSVEDQGSGIEKELLDKIGTPFFTTKENGSGLGLAICYSIAARHNAKLTFDTSNEGTIVFVRFNPAINFH